MMSAVRNSGMLLVFVCVGAYGVFTLRGPHGLSALTEKREQIRKLQEQNVQLANENEQKRERIKVLSTSRDAQDQAIREYLKLLHKHEKQVVLPRAREEK